jgi:hypothetical protein
MGAFAICPCRNCGGRIEFDATGFAKGEVRAVECPHCHLETDIFVPVAQKVPPPGAPTSATCLPPVIKAKRPIIRQICIRLALCAVIFAIVGFVGLRIWARHYIKVATGNHQLIDANVRPVNGAYGFKLADVLPDNFETRSNDDASGITYDFNIPEGDMILEGWLVLTESKQIAEISIVDIRRDHFESVKTALREKYGLRETSQFMGKTVYFFGTTNRQATLTDGNLHGLDYRDEGLIKIADTQTKNRKAAAKKQVEDAMKSHL